MSMSGEGRAELTRIQDGELRQCISSFRFTVQPSLYFCSLTEVEVDHMKLCYHINRKKCPLISCNHLLILTGSLMASKVALNVINCVREYEYCSPFPSGSADQVKI